MFVDKLPNEIKKLIKEYIYFTPHNCEIAKEALECMIFNGKEGTKKYGAISNWDTSMLKIKTISVPIPALGDIVFKFKDDSKNISYNDLEPHKENFM